MVLELTLMVLAGLGMIALLVHKHLELTRGIETRVQDVREKADPILLDIHETSTRVAAHLTIRNLLVALNHAVVHAVRFVMNISHKAHQASAHFVEKASKKTEDLSKAGAASFYLKQISETKNGMGDHGEEKE